MSDATARISRVAWAVLLAACFVVIVSASVGYGTPAVLALLVALLCVPVAQLSRLQTLDREVQSTSGSASKPPTDDGVESGTLPEDDAWRTDHTREHWMVRLAEIEYDPKWDLLLAPVLAVVGIAALAAVVVFGEGGRETVWLLIVAVVCLNGALIGLASSTVR